MTTRSLPHERRRTLAALVAVAATLVACTNAPDDSASQVRNATIPPAIAPGLRSPLLAEAGGTMANQTTLDWSKFATPDTITPTVDPASIRLDPTTIDRLTALTGKYQYLPIVMRLPVAYDPVARAAVLKRAAPSETVRLAGVIPLGSDDTAIVAATAALSAAISKLPNWDSRSLSGISMRQASLEFYNRAAPSAQRVPYDAVAPTVDGRAVTGAAYIAQLGQVPYVRALLTADEVRGLVEQRLAVDAWVDGVAEAALADSTELIGSSEPATFLGMNGAGTSVAVFDSGVLATHPAFGGRVALQRCFSAESDCRNGLTVDTGAAAAFPCTWHAGCDHGTHVAGIIAGGAVPVTTFASPTADGSTVTAGAIAWHAGVAPAANILAYRLASCASTSPCFYDSDFIAAAGNVATLATTRNIVAVNYSVGSSKTFARCDAATYPGIRGFIDAIDTLTALNVATVIAAGNSSSTSEMSWPGCVANAVSVGNTTKSDVVASDSNVAASTDLFAPGSNIVAASATGPTLSLPAMETKSGTSMATPHVVGSWALIRQLMPTMNVASVLALLQAKGLSVIDTRAGGSIAKPRLDLHGVLPLATSTGTSASRQFTGTRLTLSQGTGFVPSGADWSGKITFPAGGLNPTLADYAALYFTTRGGKPASVTINGATYDAPSIVEIGYSDSPCRAKLPMRAYRIQLNVGTAALTNSVVITMAGTSAYVDGGSLFVVGKAAAGSSSLAGVVIAEGLGVLNSQSPQASAALPFGTDVANRSLALHLAVADGQTAGESAVVLRTSAAANGSVVTAANLFTGSDGGNWDDLTFDLSGKGLTGTPGLVAVSQAGITAASQRDCLAIPAAMLNVGSRPLLPMVTPSLARAVAAITPIDPTVYRIPKITFTAPAIVRR